MKMVDRLIRYMRRSNGENIFYENVNSFISTQLSLSSF